MTPTWSEVRRIGRHSERRRVAREAGDPETQARIAKRLRVGNAAEKGAATESGMAAGMTDIDPARMLREAGLPLPQN